MEYSVILFHVMLLSDQVPGDQVAGIRCWDWRCVPASVLVPVLFRGRESDRDSDRDSGRDSDRNSE